jgi:hypothetical protein
MLLALCAGIPAVKAPAALAKAPANHGGGLVLSSFQLEGTHGYTVELIELREADFPPTVIAAAHRAGLRASYEVPGELEAGVHAVFGSLGQVEVAFHRRKRTVDRPEKGCRWITETGVFRGEFSFAGEGGYTAADATSANGEVLRLPNGFCGLNDDRRGLPTPDFLRSTSVAARSRTAHGFVQFEATAHGFASKFGFGALVREVVGPMTISRTASAGAGEGIVFGPGTQPRNASVAPPPPFEGSARFQNPAGGHPTWTGSLSVSLPGAPAVTLAGPGFTARLCSRLSLLAECKVPLPPRTGGGPQL